MGNNYQTTKEWYITKLCENILKLKENVESNLQEDSRECLLRVLRQKSELKKQRLMIEYLESQEKEVKVNRFKVGSQ